MRKRSDILDELAFLTDKISAQVRTVALGVLVLTWGLLIGESATAKSITQSFKAQFLAIGGGAILTMFFDFLQYVAGYVNTKHLFARMEKDHVDEGEYNYKSWSYSLRLFFFQGKCWLLGITVTWLLSVIAWWLLHNVG